MKVADLERYRDFGLCAGGLDKAYERLGHGEYDTPRAMAKAYIDRGGAWLNVIRVAALLTNDRSWVYLVVRLVFEVIPAPLNEYATTLGPDNWDVARHHVKEIYDDHDDNDDDDTFDLLIYENTYFVLEYDIPSCTSGNIVTTADGVANAIFASKGKDADAAQIAEEKAIQRILDIALSAVEGESK